MTIARTLALALAVAVLAVPAAQAMPIDGPVAPAALKQDLRSPDARDAATHPRPPVIVQPGQPTWPLHPQRIVPVRTPAPTGDTGGADWILVGLAGALAVAVSGGGVALARRTRRLQRVRVGV